MQDDLIERLRTQADAMMFNDCLEPCTMREAADAGEADNARIAALEADNARLMGLVKEAGDHMVEQITHIETRIADGDEMGARVWRIALEDVARENRAALAKIKEATDA